MRRFIVIISLTALVFALSPISAPAFAAKTLDALPDWNVPYMIVHAEDIPKVLSRLGNSFLFEAALDEATRKYVVSRGSYQATIFARYARSGFIEWARNSPVESLSFAMGLQWPNIGSFFGAIRFSSDKQEFLTQLSSITDEDDAGNKLKNTMTFFSLIADLTAKNPFRNLFQLAVIQ